MNKLKASDLLRYMALGTLKGYFSVLERTLVLAS